MKTKEIDVYIQTTTSTDDRTDYLVSTKSFMRDLSVKAKLILPAGPEVIEFEIGGGIFKEPAIEKVLKDNPIIQKLSGRRWKCRFEEIVE